MEVSYSIEEEYVNIPKVFFGADIQSEARKNVNYIVHNTNCAKERKLFFKIKDMIHILGENDRSNCRDCD